MDGKCSHIFSSTMDPMGIEMDDWGVPKMETDLEVSFPCLA